MNAPKNAHEMIAALADIKRRRRVRNMPIVPTDFIDGLRNFQASNKVEIGFGSWDSALTRLVEKRQRRLPRS